MDKWTDTTFDNHEIAAVHRAAIRSIQRVVAETAQPHQPEVALEGVAGMLRAGRVLALTGAGVSTESGIPDYRGPAGSLREHRPMTYQEFRYDDAARQRYATKLYDPARKVPPEVVADLLEVLRLAPSSVNSQPWHFFVAESAEARDRIARSMEPRNPYNADKTRAASHVVVFCARTHLPDAHLDNVLAHEAAAGRFASPEARAQRTAVMNEYVRLHQETRHDGPEWTARQVYLALGFFLLAAASAGVDATPIEGFNEAALDEDLNLPAQDLRSLAIVTLGYHADGDLNATAAKSRLPKDEVFTFL